jgi:hypothetical protein
MKNMRKWIIATLLLASATFAQQTHNQYEPPNGPGTGQKLLGQFAGDWDVVKTFFPMEGKPRDQRHVQAVHDPGRQISAVRFYLHQ